nr:CpsB/CapC family capsule biosynthesis tyrosine phosphatase [Bowmanella dokdonensis]
MHCHLLPKLDDGARSDEEAIALARYAVENGITHSVLTPHINPGHYDNDLAGIETAHRRFRQLLQQHDCPLNTTYAAEVRICPELINMQASHCLPFLGRWQGQQVLLLELPHSHIPAGTEQVIHWLLSQQILPLVAHPERNRDILADYRKATWLKSQGCLFQVTAGAFCGRFRSQVKQVAEQLLADGLIHLVASDAHNLERRPPDLREGYAAVERLAGVQTADNLFKRHPWQIISHRFDE